MHFHILTLFPDMVMQGLSQSIIGRAAERGLLSIETVNIRDYTKDRHRKVDDYPYGGGAGMLMQAQPVYDAWKAVKERIADRAQAVSPQHVPCGYATPQKGQAQDAREQTKQAASQRVRTVYVTPQGATFTQQMAKELAKEEDVIFLCGHYEGIDERVLEEIVTDYISIGDYVLTGGELPAMVMIDAISRMVPGVLTNGESGDTESFEGNLLEYPQYSRPEEWHGKSVPKVLLSGNQRMIDAWRREAAVARTRERRPDLYRKYEQGQECIASLKKQKLLHMDMIELIARGQAQIIFAEGANICLRDMASGIYFHTAENENMGKRMLKELAKQADAASGVGLLVLHQEFMVEQAKRQIGLSDIMACSQVVYTKREKLPVTGLYSVDGEEHAGQPGIRPLGMEHIDAVVRHYGEIVDREYIADRIAKQAMFGAFLGGELAGFVGMHAEGSIGMLHVLPEYRGRKFGKALETYMINRCLERGYTPYGQVAVGNGISKQLQESLGLCFSRSCVYWLEKAQEEEKER
ncbi:MAG: tRNA (guanosine(37)-N1)-methyltransferase TrmD [Roseburia sp.]|nr:tRNA (guanosine(37)-N1)-methyltransferase TrmD [Roseburia sp.]